MDNTNFAIGTASVPKVIYGNYRFHCYPKLTILSRHNISNNLSFIPEVDFFNNRNLDHELPKERESESELKPLV